MANYDEQYLKQTTLAVLGVLRDMQDAAVSIRIQWPQGQMVSTLLAVSHTEIILDYGSQSAENASAGEAVSLSVDAEMQGGKVSFTLDGVKPITYEQKPAFSAPLPKRLWFMQRRQYFRINTPGWPLYYGEVALASQPPLRFRLCDLSLGGVGAVADSRVPESIKPGARLHDVELHLGEWGTFRFDVELMAISEHQHLDKQLETVHQQRLSMRFLGLTPNIERELQRIIFSLERAAREKMSRVR